MKKYIIWSDYIFDNKKEPDIIGIITVENDEIYKCELLCPENRFDFPIELFGLHRDWEIDDKATIIRFLESRVVPRNRQFIDEMLRQNGLDHWELDSLLKLNHGKSTDDKFRVEIEYGN